ncbi:recombinase family protein [Streptacidiphilus sp. P02-A3a]|uniref:recombinase family protein n=1 Tax=Streptacidiphilus sp. P02-A3a TaxID=2704468 RepID=UPI0015FCBEA8|nr:recombinase family protein [Streptacidiphilus sp. P02-A3a]QMU73352.1 recombinase family protein [Streptacidiphilus sp. P02-A3a]
MKPLIYGYMRVTDELDDAQLLRIEQLLVRHAEAEGYHLGMIFHNYAPGCLNTFAELVDTLRRSEAGHVIVPSLDHFARHPALQRALVGTLASQADAEVIEVGEVGWDGKADACLGGRGQASGWGGGVSCRRRRWWRRCWRW